MKQNKLPLTTGANTSAPHVMDPSSIPHVDTISNCYNCPLCYGYHNAGIKVHVADQGPAVLPVLNSRIDVVVDGHGITTI